MKNAKVAFWTVCQSQTKTFQKLVFKLATISWSKLCIPFNRWLSSSLNLPKIGGEMSFPFNFAKILKGRHFTVRESKNLKLSPVTAIDTTFRKNVLASLLLFYFICYEIVFSHIKWTEIASSAARNFNNNWPMYVKFSEMINVCRNIWLIENANRHIFLFLK